MMYLGDFELELRPQFDEVGILFDPNVPMDGEIHRRATAKSPRGKDAAIVGFSDNPATVWFHNFQTGGQRTWTNSRGRDLSPADRSRLKRKIEAAKARKRAEREARQRAAAKKAEALFLKALPANIRHPYLMDKGIRRYGEVRQLGEDLVIPVVNINGAIRSLQYIAPDGTKRFLSGGQIGGHFTWLPAKDRSRTGPIILVEGYATGCSIRQATRLCVCVAFNAGNLKPVAVALRERFPDRHLIFAADNDCATEGNPGLAKSYEAARAVGAWRIYPCHPENPNISIDFNDLHQGWGIENVTDYFKEVADGKKR